MNTVTSGTNTYTYSYDKNGLRTQKTVNGQTINYYYNGSLLMGMDGLTYAGTNVSLYFSYDATGNVVSVDYSSNGGTSSTTYYYVRNAQGDIIGLVNGSGKIVVTYEYDTWGKLLSITGSLPNSLGTLNPFRYRGYVYDTETGWYYLQSRYYDPELGRFISSDVYLSTGQGITGHNAYAYCLNNPVNLQDGSGCRPASSATFLSDGEYKIPLDFLLDLREKDKKQNEIDIVLSKKATNRPDSGLIGVPDEEIQRRARDKSLSGEERNRYKEEEKVRGLRNKQKRASKIESALVIGIGVLCIVVLAIDDCTLVGTSDDILIPAIVVEVSESISVLFAS